MDYKKIKQEGWHLHFFISALLVIFVGFFWDLPAAIITTLIVGIAKELVDKYIRKTKFSISDIIADILGIFLGSALIYGFWSFIDSLPE